MKKTLLTLSLTLMSLGLAWSQCIPTCSVYAVSAIPFTTFPSAGTNAIPSFAPTQDDGYVTVPIGFSFNFYCTSYTSVLICSNGFLQFNIGVPPVQNQADATQSFPDPTAPNGMVALNMNDLDPGSGGSVTYTTVGTAPNRMFVLTYSNVPVYGYPASLNTGQIVLHETTNIIEIHTGNVLNGGFTNGTQGIENATGTLGATVPGRNNVIWSDSNSGYQFSPYSPVPPASVMGNTTLCQGTSATYSVAAQAGASSYTWTYPAGWNGTSTTTALTATAGAAGNISVAATYTCGTSAATTLSINSIPAPVVSYALVDPMIICSGLTFTILPAGAASYTLNPGNYTGTSSFVITAGASTTYTLMGADVNNCLSYNNPSTYVQVLPGPTVTVNSGSVCSGTTFTINPAGADSYNVSGGFFNVTPAAAGVYNYSVTGTNSTNFCTSQFPAVSTLTVVANPTITLSSSKAAICKGETVTIGATGASTYSWNTGGLTASISVTPTNTTVYSVTGTNTAGCARTKTISVIVSSCLGIEALSQQNESIQVYPNPGSGLYHLQLGTAADGNTISVYNTTGQLILSQKAEALSTEIDLTSQPHGLYYIKAVVNGQPYTVKLIKD